MDCEQVSPGKEGQSSNADFEEYYQKQQIVPEGEWNTFLKTLRTPLPTTFRINGSGKFAADLRDRLAHNFLKTLGYGAIRVSRSILLATAVMALEAAFSQDEGICFVAA